MPRSPRLAPAGQYLHITQRGNYGQPIFADDTDRAAFLRLMAFYADQRGVRIAAYCLMPNHYHLVAAGICDHSISRFMQALNGRFALYMHGKLGRKGRFWQDRYFSSLLTASHCWQALRYVEQNPVRAGLARNPADYHWSSCRANIGRDPYPPWLDDSLISEHYHPREWQDFLRQEPERFELGAFRQLPPIAIAHSV